MDPLGAAGIVLSLGIAFWERHKARASERKTVNMLKQIPRQISDALPALAASLQAGKDASQPTITTGLPFITSFADIDNDGNDELLVQHIAGAHGAALLVFGMRQWNFKLIGELGVGTPEGFTVADFDNDGRLEVGTKEADDSTGLPYFAAPRVQLWYRWEGEKFVEVGRKRDYTDEELAERRRYVEGL